MQQLATAFRRLSALHVAEHRLKSCLPWIVDSARPARPPHADTCASRRGLHTSAAPRVEIKGQIVQRLDSMVQQYQQAVAKLSAPEALPSSEMLQANKEMGKLEPIVQQWGTFKQLQTEVSALRLSVHEPACLQLSCVVNWTQIDAHSTGSRQWQLTHSCCAHVQGLPDLLHDAHTVHCNVIKAFHVFVNRQPAMVAHPQVVMGVKPKFHLGYVVYGALRGDA